MKCFQLLILVLFWSLLLGCSQNKVIESSTINTSGIDVSSHQGKIDFGKVYRGGIGYVFIRATDGVTYQDPQFRTNYQNAKAAGLIVGAYHFYRNEDDPLEQLNNFTRNTDLTKGDLAPVVDIEKLSKSGDGNFVKDLTVFLDGLEKHYHVKPIIYSGKNFTNAHLAHFSDHVLWLAEYGVEQPEIPEWWDNWAFWQWSQSGRVDGITQVVDMSRFNKKVYDFQQLLIHHDWCLDFYLESSQRFKSAIDDNIHATELNVNSPSIKKQWWKDQSRVNLSTQEQSQHSQKNQWKDLLNFGFEFIRLIWLFSHVIDGLIKRIFHLHSHTIGFGHDKAMAQLECKTVLKSVIVHV